MIVSQGYDGATVMSGQCSGVQLHIKAIAPQAIYVHCYTNTLNLVLDAAVKAVKIASKFFDMLKASFFYSPVEE